MEKVKEAGKQVGEAGKKAKAALDKIRENEWAERTGSVLKVAAKLVEKIPFPAGAILKGVCSMGGTLLNPDPSLADLRRAKEEIKDEMKAVFGEVVNQGSKLGPEITTLRRDVETVLELISDKEFYEGIREVDAHYEFYSEGADDLEVTNENFKAVATQFQISFKKNFVISKIFKFMKIVQQREGNDACAKFYQDNLVSYGKYLQVLVLFLTFTGDLNRINILINKFNNDYKELSTLFDGMKVIPEDEEVMKRQETVRPRKPDERKEEFDDAEVANLVEKAKEMEAKAENGLILEVNTLFSHIFEMLKFKNFKSNQKAKQCEIYCKIVKIHNIKSCYDEAMVYTKKMFECLDADSPTILKIEALSQGAVAFNMKNEFGKGDKLEEKALSMCIQNCGEDSKEYANVLVTCGGSNKALEKALTIVTKEEGETSRLNRLLGRGGGENSVLAAKILREMAWNNYSIQYDSTENYDEATEQAEKAIKMLSKKLGKDNFCLVEPKNSLAAIIQEKALAESSEKKKEKLFSEVEKLQREIVQMSTAALGDFNHWTAGMISNLGKTLKNMKKNSEAEELLLKALKILKAINGPVEESVASTHNFLAVLYKNNMNELTKAEEHFLQTIKIHEELFGPAYSQLQYSYNGIIELYRKTGEDAKRREYEEKKEKWEKLQNKDNEEKGKGEEEEKEMNFQEMVNFVTKN